MGFEYAHCVDDGIWIEISERSSWVCVQSVREELYVAVLLLRRACGSVTRNPCGYGLFGIAFYSSVKVLSHSAPSVGGGIEYRESVFVLSRLAFPGIVRVRHDVAWVVVSHSTGYPRIRHSQSPYQVQMQARQQ